MKINNKLLFIPVILIFIAVFIGGKGELVENLEIPVGVGVDVEKTPSGIAYKIPIVVYSFEDANKIESYQLLGEGSIPPDTRQDRQLKANKKFILGLNKIFVYSEASAKNGLKPFLDLNLNNPEINDRAWCVIFKGKAQDILNYKVKGYKSSSDYIEGMIKNLNEFNFFSKQYTFTDIFVRCSTEGRTALLPYIEIKDGLIQTTGLAIFNKDKMVANVGIEESRVINMLKENNVKGIVSVERSPKRYTSFYGVTKRKIKCYKKDGKYQFIINLKLKGKIVTNQLYKNITSDSRQLQKFKFLLEKSVEQNCNQTIKDITKKYKVDVLDLGRVATAKYGKHTGTDWNKAVSESDIKVNVKVEIDDEGRGDY
ncbi:Ger(x)C family germination protein [Clostridium acetobutylicum]|uniref:Spore germination protein, gerKC n=1 Tax=Clostridium acetobutylicum (strain ATCC 824 / DSM 792 / JCM 1419 / IAM 19013 / LMG 5710 / NBRC 13948 / NRRL B-527 / VKM B-1787 / 2291 / W) TaxID=272562 RepID=Q97LG3_CLOAB|nr:MULTISPECIES: Ger(x)C family spore germination protein [Clostridium]AAK78576.1 Spore germination protein, gerKC [Clostridium acetobutylicum ATCC 824]ADZ19650.1 Spore germination protein, gerKC [Clostridium acetobutylicum EA 2018]AEI33381.1 spore germination protein, gerKC [Clostridium acetobutylicum DSM 1731]AWV80300.1 Ger(x)C family spore germination protein [Clostridium acetobutylicum]MBC2392485.1 Ger(x)C family spore germination protein [Clostridium acetobutylicum]